MALPGSGIADLVLNARVQKELKLTDDQTKSIRQAQEKLQKQFADKVEAIFKPRDREKADPKDAAEISKKVNSELRKAIETALEPGQLKRLGQIELQQQGLRALENKEVALALKLTVEQKGRVKALIEDLESKLRKTMPSLGTFGRDRAGLAKAVEKAKEEQVKLFREAVDMIPSLLTPDQRKTWEDLTGERFELGQELRPVLLQR